MDYCNEICRKRSSKGGYRKVRQTLISGIYMAMSHFIFDEELKREFQLIRGNYGGNLLLNWNFGGLLQKNSIVSIEKNFFERKYPIEVTKGTSIRYPRGI